MLLCGVVCVNSSFSRFDIGAVKRRTQSFIMYLASIASHGKNGIVCIFRIVVEGCICSDSLMAGGGAAKPSHYS